MHLGIAITWCKADRAADICHDGPGRIGVFQIGPGQGNRSSFEECYGVQAERLANLVQEGRQWPRAAQYATGQREQRGGLSSGPRRFPSSARRNVDDCADRHRDNEKREEGSRFSRSATVSIRTGGVKK